MTKYKAKYSGKVYNTREEAMQDNAAYLSNVKKRRESPGNRLVNGWYDNTIGLVGNIADAIADGVATVFRKPAPPAYGGGSSRGGGYTSTWVPGYRPKNKSNFNAAFDEARDAGAETFIFGDKLYNTIKEGNPIREYNNRHVGHNRTEEQIRQRNGYGKDYGPIGGIYSVLPVIPYAYGGEINISNIRRRLSSGGKKSR